ncbi:CDP-glycerol glycerophosphotransferase family protein [Lentibacillus lipolyticus]|nr:CDP-glycerol glycerophosphotransferase family protein [Lentibacillus lipolyticus]
MKDRSCRYPFDASIGDVLPFDIRHPLTFLQAIYHLATGTVILADNYFGFLAVTDFRQDTTCIQLWHASGAMKQFGLNDPSVQTRSRRAKARFQAVYSRFDYTVTASEQMAAIFRDSFGIRDTSILRTGFPRTDFFFHEADKHEAVRNVRATYPAIAGNGRIAAGERSAEVQRVTSDGHFVEDELVTSDGRGIILYAPTYRDHQLHSQQLMLDIDQMYQALANDYMLLVKMHPAANWKLDAACDGFVYDVSDYYDINHLLLLADVLITDYSSIPFEFALLEKPMIFYPYDLDEYDEMRGLPEHYVSQVPGPVVFTTDGIIRAILDGAFQPDDVRDFSSAWNEYTTGHASLDLARFLTGTEAKKQKQQSG